MGRGGRRGGVGGTVRVSGSRSEVRVRWVNAPVLFHRFWRRTLVG